MSDIKAEVEELEKALKTLNTAITKFEPYNKEFIKNASDSLDSFNSDFASNAQSLLSSMTDTKAPKMLKKMQEYASSVQEVLNTFVTTDSALADSYNQGG